MKKAVPAGRQGSALLIIIFVFSLFTVLAALSLKIVYNCYASANATLRREQAFYLAEAGLEKAKVELTHNPSWYTDPPHYIEDDSEWLVNSALGKKMGFAEGSFKIIKERGKNRLYSVGLRGKGVVVLKLEFSAPPFKVLKWKEL